MEASFTRLAIVPLTTSPSSDTTHRECLFSPRFGQILPRRLGKFPSARFRPPLYKMLRGWVAGVLDRRKTHLAVSLPVLVRLPATPPETAPGSPAPVRPVARTETSRDTLSEQVAQDVRGAACPIHPPETPT